MILDKVENIGRYPFLNKVQNFPIGDFQKGRFEIEGYVFFGIGLEYDTKAASDCLWEAHRTYLDVHYILEGEEYVNITDISSTVVTKEYDQEGDYGLFDGTSDNTIHLKPGMFLALFPNEVHQTAVKVTDSVRVRKIVFKVKL